MITVYRFAPKQFIDDLSGKGAMLYGGRWNSIGLPAVYTSYTISLALVELFIHKQTFQDILANHLMEITIDEKLPSIIENKQLKKNWQSDAQYSQLMGNDFLTNPKNLCLQVPSAIIEEENNMVLNPQHKDFYKKVQIKQVRPFSFDNRLFKTA